MYPITIEFQSTLPREERRKFGGVYLNGSISIHAPTRGATCFHFVKLLWGLFQSTLPREERPTPNNFLAVSLSFQSTLPREERRLLLCYLLLKLRTLKCAYAP